ncbi:aromatic amino acid ammonia-lyase [Porphyromonadaceae bacterium OttesenSCG-928-L07]|nr:aromatic amino acid ammonia-lyase [Porphyromonadaceae bacterium OttesenSCG-928-L07]MDL2331094.1 aromatic amino acid ammonia-lyase [Odoribacter sp. OttesenSCG-928-A06]
MTDNKLILTLEMVEKLLFQDEKLNTADLPTDEVVRCYEFLKSFSSKKIIYGINTGFGPMAQWRVDDQYLTDLQYNIIRSHSTGAGEALPDRYVKAAMIARLGTFLQARSGIHVEVIELLVEFINRGIYPYIPSHGSVGASGDLVQLAHMALTLIGEGEVHYKGEWRKSADVMKENGLKPFNIHIREGLSITNGTSVMTGIGMINQFRAEQLLDWVTLASAWMNEITSSYDDYAAIELNQCRRHKGQQIIAARLRNLMEGSCCLQKREHELYDEKCLQESVFKQKVQSYYSLRCTPQILGPVYETLLHTRTILEEELNSACDNPIVDPDAQNVYHGGNFHGDYISLEEDKVKIAITRVAMLAERQLNYLLHDRINDILPPFLNLGVLGLNYGMQACQFTATSTTAECQTLSMPNYVHSIPNNNDNQDIVSMGTNSALICKTVIENTFQVMSIHYIALAQAVDCLKIVDKLSPTTRRIYEDIRKIIPTILEDTPFYNEIAEVENYLKQNPLRLK